MKHRKSGFAKEYVEIADSYKPVLNKMITTSVQCVKYDFVAPLMYICILNVNIYASINDYLFKYIYLVCYVKFRF